MFGAPLLGLLYSCRCGQACCGAVCVAVHGPHSAWALQAMSVRWPAFWRGFDFCCFVINSATFMGGVGSARSYERLMSGFCVGWVCAQDQQSVWESHACDTLLQHTCLTGVGMDRRLVAALHAVAHGEGGREGDVGARDLRARLWSARGRVAAPT